MSGVSVVIICRNEASVIGAALECLVDAADDIVVYDNGSTDATRELVKKYAVTLVEGSWEGFGMTKNKANTFAKHDWILSLDADELIDDELKASLLAFKGAGENVVYDISFKSYLGDKELKYGEWGGDHHIRLFNRKVVRWNDAPVHEELLLPPGTTVKKLKGAVRHKTMADMDEYVRKMGHYALLNAEKYARQRKKATWFKLRVSPGFTFFHYYILKLGFLDGHAGYVCAKMTAWYTFLKYARLKELNEQQKNSS